MDWKKFFDSLGMNGTVWQWRIMNWKRRWQEGAQWQVKKVGHTAYQHKLCRECGQMVDRHTKVCPYCQSRVSSWRLQVIQRFFGLMPHNTVTKLLLAVNGINFGVLLILFGFENIWNPTIKSLLLMGGWEPRLFLIYGEYWRLITCGYLHIGILHIGFNMMALAQVGPALERNIRGSRFFTVYTISLIGGSLANLLWRPEANMVGAGASGALFGLIGFGISYEHFYGGPVSRQLRNFFFKWAIYGLLFGYVIGADNVAHMGGLISGLVMGFIIEKERKLRGALDSVWMILALICLVATLGSFVWMIWMKGGVL